MIVRRAEPHDLHGILAIVNREIREGVAHFGTSEHTLGEMKGWLAQARRMPLLVAVDGAQGVLGYAKAGRYRDRQAYDWAVEVGVYVCPGAQGRGVGRALYDLLFPMLEAQGYRVLIAGIALPNPASVRLHEAFGMRHVGTFPGVGFKHGRWIDVGFWSLAMGDGPPSPVVDAAP
ncbi:MAG: N-acetyltransferase [Phycisphaerales bacterium]|nr:N-acetyltransferase [Phycisphaerales bacterium]